MPRSSQLMFDFSAGRKTGERPAVETVKAPPPQTQSTPAAGIDPALSDLAVQWCRDLDLTKLADAVHVRWNARLKTTAGTACPRTSAIDLNDKLVTFGDDVVMRILKHELAHLVAHRRAGRHRIAAHGIEWRQACTELGIPNEKSRHTLPFKSTPQRRKYAYQCPACEDVTLRVRKFARFSACWTCCKKLNRGQYVERFQLQQIPLEKGVLLHKLREQIEAPQDFR
jgi:SprT protein